MKHAPLHIGLFFLLALSWCVSLPVQAQISAEQTQAIGNQLLDSEDYMLAIQYFNKAIKAKPYLCEPYYLRGLAKMMLGDYAGAEADCTHALELNSYKREPYRIRGISRMQMGKDSLALADIMAGLAQAPQERTFLYLKGISESRLKLTDKSSETFALLERIYPHFTPAYTASARNFISQGNKKAAVAELDKVLEIDKYAPEACMMRAAIAASDNDWKVTEKYLDRAIALMPGRADLYVNRGVARAASGKRASAISDFRSALEINPDDSIAQSYLSLVRSGSFTNKNSLAYIPIEIHDISYLTSKNKYKDKETKLKPEGAGMFALTFTHPYNNLQPIVYPDQELDSINRQHRLPSSLYLSKTASETPDAEQAVALFTFAETPVASNFDNTHLLGRAVAYAMLKNYDDALSDLDVVIANNPGLAIALMERAFIRVSQATMRKYSQRQGGDSTDALAYDAFNKDILYRALEDADSAVKASPGSAYAWYNRGVINELRGDDESALRDYSKAILLNDALAEAYMNRGLLHIKRGAKTQARTDLSRAGELGISQAYLFLKNL